MEVVLAAAFSGGQPPSSKPVRGLRMGTMLDFVLLASVTAGEFSLLPHALMASSAVPPLRLL